jgi:hypothetical protein
VFERLMVAALAHSGTALCQIAASAADTDAEFVFHVGKAVSTMIVSMGGPPSGDVDTDFVTTMVPHHRGAIEMAEAELRYGRNERVRRLAQEIIVTQREEIMAMHFALGGSTALTAASKEPAPQASVPNCARRRRLRDRAFQSAIAIESKPRSSFRTPSP